MSATRETKKVGKPEDLSPVLKSTSLQLGHVTIESRDLVCAGRRRTKALHILP
jgi:hypothetical protein